MTFVSFWNKIVPRVKHHRRILERESIFSSPTGRYGDCINVAVNTQNEVIHVSSPPQRQCAMLQYENQIQIMKVSQNVLHDYTVQLTNIACSNNTTMFHICAFRIDSNEHYTWTIYILWKMSKTSAHKTKQSFQYQLNYSFRLRVWKRKFICGKTLKHRTTNFCGLSFSSRMAFICSFLICAMRSYQSSMLPHIK